jgi:predicted nucleic acid-binding Zn ribbon protein
MAEAVSVPQTGAGAVATGLCGHCGKPLTGRQRVACSDRCRFQVWERRREAARLSALRRLRERVLLLTAQVEDVVAGLDAAIREASGERST